jgi:hypothetical protein
LFDISKYGLIAAQAGLAGCSAPGHARGRIFETALYVARTEIRLSRFDWNSAKNWQRKR